MEFRSHRFGDLMTKGAELTELQLNELAELAKRDSGEGRPLTDLQTKRLAELIHKRDNPELSQTAKSYILEFAIELKYGIKKDIVNKYIEKGLKCEESAIMLLNQFLGRLYVKNNIRKSNGWVTGECDIFEPVYIRDTKCSWDAISHFSDLKLKSDWEWQMRCYLELYDKEIGYVDRVLIDTPEELIQDELRRASWKMGYNDLPSELEDKIRHNLTFQYIPIEKKIRTWEIKRDPKITAKMVDRAQMATEYLIKLLEII